MEKEVPLQENEKWTRDECLSIKKKKSLVQSTVQVLMWVVVL